MRRLLAFLVPLGLLGGILSASIVFPSFTESLHLRVFDVYQHLRPRPYTETPVRVIDIDDESLKRYGQWPWPRTLLAELTQKLGDTGAAVIAYDIFFPEPDRTSPGQAVILWTQVPEIKELMDAVKRLPDHDGIFAKVLSEHKAVLAVTLTHEPAGDAPLRKAGISFFGADPVYFLTPFQGAVSSLKIFQEAAKGNGIINYLPDLDGILRRAPVIFRLNDDIYPALFAEALRVYQDSRNYIVTSASPGSRELSFGGKTGITEVQIGKYKLPTDARGRIWLYDTGYVPERAIPAWRILSGDFSPGDIKDRILLIGTSAAGLKDIRATVLNPMAAGVDVHAQLAEQALTGTHLTRDDWIECAELLFFAVFGIFLILTMPLLGAAWCALFGGVTIAGVFALSWHAFCTYHKLIDPVLPSLVCLLVYLAASLIRHMNTEAEKNSVKTAFSRYLSPALVKRLADNPEQLKLGGDRRKMTFLFSDIRNFTAIAEPLPPEDLIRLMNRFLTPMTEIILNCGGTIDKYMGDAIMAFWNAPLEDKNHAGNACEAALEMRRHLALWNEKMREEFQDKGKPWAPIQIGIGINTGECCVGNMGSDQRFDYSVLGDEVNLASRLEGLSKIYGLDIITGQSTAEAAQPFTFLEIDLTQVKGKTLAVPVFALLGDENLKKSEGFRLIRARHTDMIEAYRNQFWDTAQSSAREILGLIREDPLLGKLKLENLYRLYFERIENFRKNPPASDWNGIFT